MNEKQYGGGGIFADQATSSVDSGFSEYVFVHEFGHHFAGLGDEYYTSDVAYATGGAEHPEPWEPNITASGTHPKWMALVTPGTPLPTPWEKEEFEKHQREYQAERRRLREQNVPETQMDALFRRAQEHETKSWPGRRTRGKSVRSRAPGMRPRGCTAPRRIASCSRGTRWDSATSARARSGT